MITSEPDRTSHQRVLFWTLYLCFWTLVGLAFTLQVVLFRTGQDQPADWVHAMLVSLPDWYLWAALSPLIFQLSRRFPLSRKRWPRSLLVHLPASVVFFFAYLVPIITLDYYVIWAPRPDSPFLAVLGGMAARSATIGMLVYWGIVAVSHALNYYAKYRERELTASRLEAQLFQTQLQMLRMQLQPHFLFNTLHAVITLMHKDIDRAERMLIRLADLLRLTLDRSGIAKVPLAQELEPEKMPAVIFVTAFDRYALQAFEVHALDYLLKPFDAQRFVEALSRARQRVERGLGGQGLTPLLESLEGHVVREDEESGKGGEARFAIPAGDIDYVETAGNYVKLHTRDGVRLLRETMAHVEQLLDPARFLRIHRSTIVNLASIEQVQPWFHGDYTVILRDGTQLTMSRGYYDKRGGAL